MSVRAKFKVTSVEGEKEKTIRLEPVVGGSAENDSFYNATPGGNIMLSVLNEKASSQFEVGKEYYVDFTPAQ